MGRLRTTTRIRRWRSRSVGMCPSMLPDFAIRSACFTIPTVISMRRIMGRTKALETKAYLVMQRKLLCAMAINFCFWARASITGTPIAIVTNVCSSMITTRLQKVENHLPISIINRSWQRLSHPRTGSSSTPQIPSEGHSEAISLQASTLVSLVAKCSKYSSRGMEGWLLGLTSLGNLAVGSLWSWVIAAKSLCHESSNRRCSF